MLPEGGNPVSGEIRCRFVFSGKNDELTPDFPVYGLCASQVDGGGPLACVRLELVAKALEAASVKALHVATIYDYLANMVKDYPSRAETEARLKHSDYFINRGPDSSGTHKENGAGYLSTSKRLHEEGTEYAAIAKVIRAIMGDSDRQTIVVG